MEVLGDLPVRGKNQGKGHGENYYTEDKGVTFKQRYQREGLPGGGTGTWGWGGKSSRIAHAVPQDCQNFQA